LTTASRALAAFGHDLIGVLDHIELFVAIGALQADAWASHP
jgi:hypothetical protein